MSNQTGGERGARGGQPPAPDGDGESFLRQQRRDRHCMFEQRELAEMSQERRALIQHALHWVAGATAPAAALGWALGYALGPVSARVSPGWSPPPGVICLLLGAVCGAVGAAVAGLLSHSVLQEEREMPVVILGVATLVVIAAGVHGAGRGGAWAIVAGLALGIPAGLAAGIGALVLYSAFKWLCAWGRKEIRGY